MRALAIIVALLLAGCASKPSAYFDSKFVFQHDRGSDWVLQSERSWTPAESETRLHITGGLEWMYQIDCPYVEVILSGPWDQMFLGCSKRFGKIGKNKNYTFFFEPAIVHQVDNRTSAFLRTDQKQWQGHNPFMHLRGGIRWKNGMRCPVIATGKSVFQGAPFEKEEHAPDLYWTNFECGIRLGGKTGAFR